VVDDAAHALLLEGTGRGRLLLSGADQRTLDQTLEADSPLIGKSVIRHTKMRSRLTIVACALSVLVACALRLSPARFPDALVECTRSQIADRDARIAKVPVDNRPKWSLAAASLSGAREAAYIDYATRWAFEHEYLPCEYQMCVAFYATDEPNTTLVTIQPETNLDGWVPTAASFYLVGDELSATRVDTAHSGYANRARLDRRS
jgi:hypothetical protein